MPTRELRDYPIVDGDGKVIYLATFAEAQDFIKRGKVAVIRSKGGKGRIRCLAAIDHAPTKPERPTPIRQHGTMGDSHSNLRECRCALCRDAGAPIPEHQHRSTNPPGVWTIDALPHWGRHDWKTRAIFRRPLLECIYGREAVESCLTRQSSPSASRSTAA